MAINPMIPMAGDSVRGIPESTQNALLRGYNLAVDQKQQPVRDRILEAQAQQQEAEVEQQPIRNRLLEAQTAQAEQNVDQAAIQRQYLASKIMLQGIEQMKSLPVQQRREYADGLKATLAQQGFEDIAGQAVLPQVITDQDIAAAESNIRPFVSGYEQVNPNASGKTADIRNFEYLTQGMTPEQIQRAREIKARLIPGASISAAERIALTAGLTDTVAESEAAISGAKAGASEEAKLDVQAKKLPDIRAAIKMAEIEAQKKGETLNELKTAKAAMPGLLEVVDRLKKLAPMATHTLSGKAWNAVVKEIGFGATKGATARAAFISTVQNQVLPLLKPTFGGSFTVAEGEKLEAAFADPDATPEEKIAQLESFIAQKTRDIEAKEMETGQRQASQMSDEELLESF